MRPLRLRIQGFTCFRDEQDIDFHNLDLFAIAGPTGAGKTSILDAIVFALYGEVPRMGTQRLGELISLGLDRAAAVLDFEVGAVGYRVVRTIRRRGASQSQIERLEGGVARPLAGGVRGVAQEIEKILGIDAGTFLKAVVLPQGQFADFLQSTPGERRDMLRSLLQLDVYERMRERAHQRARTAAQTSEWLRGRLDEDYRDATAERLAAVEQRFADLAAEIDGAAAAAEVARRAFEALDRTARLRCELAAARAKLSELEASRAAVEADERRVERSERARPLVAILDTAAAARGKHDIARAEAARLAPHAGAALARFHAATESQRLAEAAAGELDDLNAARVRLEQVLPLLARRADCERRARDAEARRDRARLARDAATHEIDACTQQATAGQADLDELARALDRTGHDPGRLQRLSDALAPAADLAARYRDLARARGKLVTLDDRLARAVETRKAAGEAAERAAETSRQADARHDRARVVLELARRAHAAHDLRATVMSGEPCPVCLQIVETVPSIELPADLERAARDERAADRRRTRCASEAREAALALELAERAVSDAAASRDEAAGELAGLAAEADVLAQRLAQLVGDGARSDAAALADEISQLHAAARCRAENHARLDRQRTELDAKLARIRHRHDLARQQAQTAERDHERTGLDVEQARTELATIDAQIRIVAPSGDPEHERKRVVGRIDELTRARDEASRAAQVARAEHDRLSTGLAVAEAASATAASEAAAAEARAAEGLCQAGFDDEPAVRAAVLSTTACDDIARRARRWHSELAIAATRAGDLAQVAGSDDVDAGALAAARAEADAARDRHGKLLAEHGRLGGERGDIELRLAKATELRQQLARVQAELAIYDQLAVDLKTDQLQAYLLEGTFREIVQGASVRLLELSSGRYTLDYAYDDFFVVDHDNARERRRADTLSGGETFLTSLALALQLSEQIQRAAGAVRLDSLFIDEGFGTLDAETLATVTDSIQQLGRGHRMVGIITHVQELTEALPARIEVSRGAAGSRVRVISEA